MTLLMKKLPKALTVESRARGLLTVEAWMTVLRLQRPFQRPPSMFVMCATNHFLKSLPSPDMWKFIQISLTNVLFVISKQRFSKSCLHIEKSMPIRPVIFVVFRQTDTTRWNATWRTTRSLVLILAIFAIIRVKGRQLSIFTRKITTKLSKTKYFQNL